MSDLPPSYEQSREELEQELKKLRQTRRTPRIIGLVGITFAIFMTGAMCFLLLQVLPQQFPLDVVTRANSTALANWCLVTETSSASTTVTAHGIAVTIDEVGEWRVGDIIHCWLSANSWSLTPRVVGNSYMQYFALVISVFVVSILLLIVSGVFVLALW